MKRILSAALAASLALTCLPACSGQQSTNSAPTQGSASDSKLSIVTTIFPEYDWAKQILGDQLDNVELTQLLDSGVDLHSYQPSAQDIMKIGQCDLFVYVGGESDAWVQDALAQATNPDMVVIDLMDELGDAAEEEKEIEGAEPEEEEDQGSLDEHIWLSLKNAQTLVSSMAQGISQIDESNASLYEENAAAYNKKLADLDKRYQDTVSTASCSTLLFGDRFPFRYLADDYGLSYYAAFSGCSAESEASFETISFLAGKVDELNLHAVLVTDTSDGKIAQTIVDNTKDHSQQILKMDSLQSATSQDAAGGSSYLSAMEGNLDILKQALN